MALSKALPAYKEAQRLVSTLYDATKKAPKELRFTLVNRLLSESVELVVDIDAANRVRDASRVERLPLCYNNNSQLAEGYSMKIGPLPPIEYLRECFDYNQETGILYWRKRPASHFSTESKCKRFNTLSAGKEAGTTISHGYKVVRLTYQGKHQSYRVHRICYAMVHGDTDQIIDHINGDRQDNRLCNLRAVEFRVNIANQHTKREKGLRGAYWDAKKKRWMSQISYKYKKLHLGRFDTEREAHEAYVRAAKQLNAAT